jgi:hypothetical protein
MAPSDYGALFTAGCAALRHQDDDPDILALAVTGLLFTPLFIAGGDAAAVAAAAHHAVHADNLCQLLVGAMRRHPDSAELQAAAAGALEGAAMAADRAGLGGSGIDRARAAGGVEAVVAAVARFRGAQAMGLRGHPGGTVRALMSLLAAPTTATLAAAHAAGAPAAVLAAMRARHADANVCGQACVCLVLLCSSPGARAPPLSATDAASATHEVLRALTAHQATQQLVNNAFAALGALLESGAFTPSADEPMSPILHAMSAHAHAAPTLRRGLRALDLLLDLPLVAGVLRPRVCANMLAVLQALMAPHAELREEAPRLMAVLAAAAAAGGERPPALPAGEPSGGASCAGCGALAGGAVKLRLCGRCRGVRYCSPLCQRGHWREHKTACVAADAA